MPVISLSGAETVRCFLCSALTRVPLSPLQDKTILRFGHPAECIVCEAEHVFVVANLGLGVIDGDVEYRICGGI